MTVDGSKTRDIGSEGSCSDELELDKEISHEEDHVA